MAAATITISNDEDAWAFLEQWLESDIDKFNPTIEFKDWPRLEIRVCGKQYQSSMRSSQMGALVNFQMSMGRAYAAIAHGAYDKRRLKREEADDLEFTTSVKEGSSILNTDLSPLIDALSKVIATHPTASLAAGVVVALAIIARPMILKHFENKAKQLENEDRAKLTDLIGKISQADRKRIRSLEKTIKKLESRYPAIGQIVPDAAQSYWHFVSGSVDADLVQIGDVTLSRDNVAVLAERRLNTPRTVKTYDGFFDVIGVVKVSDRYRIQLRGESFHVSVSYKEKTVGGVGLLTRAMANSVKIQASIEVKELEGARLTGRLLTFQLAAPPNEEPPKQSNVG